MRATGRRRRQRTRTENTADQLAAAQVASRCERRYRARSPGGARRRALAGHRPRFRTADGACTAAVSDRLRVGLAFAMSGHREVDDMISRHAALAAALAGQLGLPDDVLDGIGGAYERWDGRGWPSGRKGEEIPLASRIAQLAEYAEVAHRVGGFEGATSLARRRSAAPSARPTRRQPSCAPRSASSGGPRPPAG